MTLSDASHTGRQRAQNEPLAVLIAVSLFIGGLLLFAGYHHGVVSLESDRAVEEPTLERVYADLNDDGTYDLSSDFNTTISDTALPNGYVVSVSITSISTATGDRDQLEKAYFSTDGTPITDPSERHALAERLETDTDARAASRPITVRDGGEMRGARLRVAVWRE